MLNIDKKFTLSDGREFTSNKLTEFYKGNLRNGKHPMAGYFCPLCHNEVLYDKNFVCTHCNCNIKEN